MTRLPTITEIAMRQHTMNNVTVVVDLDFLAREISDAHRQVLFHGKSMVAEAIRAGKALERAKVELKAKRKLDPALPTFVRWVEDHCGCTHSQAARYMKAAGKVGGASNFLTEGITLHEFLYGERQADQRARQKEEAAATFSREDAEYALKILAMAERGATEGERAVAATKLSRLAAQFGMSPEVMAAKAKAMIPDAEKADGEKRREKAEAEWKDAATRLAKHDAIAARLRKQFAKASKEDLIDVLAGALMRLEEAGLT